MPELNTPPRVVQVCAWCQPPLREADLPPGTVITHGICERCQAAVLEENARVPQLTTST
jgi:hypothetical protein